MNNSLGQSNIENELIIQYPEIFTTTLQQKVKRAALFGVSMSLVFLALWRNDFFDWSMMYHGVLKIESVIRFMLPPAHNGWMWDFLYAILETLAMAFLGTFIASVVSVPLGLLGAKNIVPGVFFHFAFRRIFDWIRGIDILIWALVFVNVVGLGPFAGILAIAVSDTGTLSKLFAEGIENIDKDQVEGVYASGAGHIQAIRYALFPQILPVIISNSLYFFESNVRCATVLGVVGAGGIGLVLSDRIRVNNWDEAAFIIILILITVSIIDTLSKEIRSRIINLGKNTHE